MAVAERPDARRFCASIWPRAAWNRDLDTGSYADVLAVLSDKTATPWARVCETTFGGYRGFPTRALTRHGRSPWLLRTGERTSQCHRAGVAYCPACLQEDADPYFRRPWRLAFVTVCPHHRCPLREEGGTIRLLTVTDYAWNPSLVVRNVSPEEGLGRVPGQASGCRKQSKTCNGECSHSLALG